MINQIVVLDGQDERLGDFFSLCADHASSLCAGHRCEINSQRHDTGDVTSANIGDVLSRVNQQGFLFLSFVHGSPDSMVIDDAECFVSTEHNYYLFTNGFVYTFSCYTGTELADKLLGNGAVAFLGYTDSAWVCHPHLDDFKKAALSGYHHFLDGDSADVAYCRMIEDMNAMIDEMYEKDFVAANYLMKNRDALILKGYRGLTIDDFNL